MSSPRRSHRHRTSSSKSAERAKPSAGNRRECIFCEKIFANYSALQVHMNLHTGERPYQCLSCDATFGNGSSLDYHRKKDCLKKMEVGTLKSSTLLETATSSKEGQAPVPIIKKGLSEKEEQDSETSDVTKTSGDCNDGVLEVDRDQGRATPDNDTEKTPEVEKYYYAGNTPLPSPPSSLSSPEKWEDAMGEPALDDLVGIEGKIPKLVIDEERKLEAAGSQMGDWNGRDIPSEVIVIKSSRNAGNVAPTERTINIKKKEELDPKFRSDASLSRNEVKAGPSNPKLDGSKESAPQSKKELAPEPEPVEELFPCQFCSEKFATKKRMKKHRDENHSVSFAMYTAMIQRNKKAAQ